MGFLQQLGDMLTGRRPAAPTASTPSTSLIKSPWSEGNLESIVWRDIFGLDVMPVTRAEAMSVPAIARARHRLAADAARCPLTLLSSDGTEAPDAAWLQHTSTATSPQHRMVWTVDDLIFHGWSLWIVRRSGDQIIDAARCPFEWWNWSADGGRIEINSQPVDPSSVVLIPGYHEGIIASAGPTIRGSRQLEELWQTRSANPIPAVELHQTTADRLTDAEIKTLIRDWRAAITAEDGAVGYTPHSIEAKVHGAVVADLLIQGRNAAAIDAARVVGVPAAIVDASNVNSTLTYETLGGRNLEYVQHSLSAYLGPIEARLSLDDVTPAGTRVRANVDDLTTPTPAPTGTPTED